MQGIYSCAPETNHAYRVYNVAAVLWLQCLLRVMLFSTINVLYFYISTFRSMCAVLNTAVFYNSLMSCFPGMLLVCSLNDFEMVLVAPVISGIALVFTFQVRCISNLLLLLLLLLLLAQLSWCTDVFVLRYCNYCVCQCVV
jgi:hypothetical protein